MVKTKNVTQCGNFIITHCPSITLMSLFLLLNTYFFSVRIDSKLTTALVWIHRLFTTVIVKCNEKLCGAIFLRIKGYSVYYSSICDSYNVPDIHLCLALQHTPSMSHEQEVTFRWLCCIFYELQLATWPAGERQQHYLPRRCVPIL